MAKKLVKKATGGVAGVINNYTKKAASGKPGGPSYASRNPAPSFKKGGCNCGKK